MEKILVIQTAFIGDVVLATALLEKLHQYFPDAAIDMAVRKGNEKLLDRHPFLHEVIIWDKKQNKKLNLFSVLKRIRKKKYDKVINLQRFFATGLLTALSKGKETIGFDKNPLSFLFTKKITHRIEPGVHEVERNNDLIRSFTDTIVNKPKLYPSAEDFLKTEAYKKTPYITITPSSVWFTKQYPLEKWIEFINAVPGKYHIYLLGGPENKNDCEKITIAATNKNTTVLAGSLGFLQSSALMKDAAMNYANDSAPLHFASAVNAPVTAVFCSTVPDFGFTPLSDISYIVETLIPLDCRPCGLHGHKACPLGHFRCAYNIQNSQLLNALP